MPQDPGAHLDRLPDELLLNIIEQSEAGVCTCGEHHVKLLSPLDLISLACTSRRYYGITITTAYKRHVEEQNGLAIYWAIENEQHGTLDRLVENGVDVNMRDDEHAYSGNLIDIVGRFHWHDLKKKKAFMNPDPLARFSPLAWAASLGNDAMVEYLLDHDAAIEQLSENLCSCSHNKLLRCPQTLPGLPEFYSRDSDDSDDSDDDEYEPRQWKALHYALCNRKESTAMLLIERGANVDNIGEYRGVTALHIATRWELDDTIEYLLDKDCVNINSKDYYGVTALHMAQVAERDDLVDKYLDHGADINLEYSDQLGPWTIFVMACVAGDYVRALEYLKRGADPHFELDGEDSDGPWTVMRLIYQSSHYDRDEYPEPGFDERMELEREIIARGRERKA